MGIFTTCMEMCIKTLGGLSCVLDLGHWRGDLCYSFTLLCCPIFRAVCVLSISILRVSVQ
jgi:hypothetical protein